MEPKEFFNKKIVGKITTRTIESFNLRQSVEEEFKKTSYVGGEEFEVIDVLDDGKDKVFVLNIWENESEKAVKCFHNNFVKEFVSYEQK